MSGGIGGRSGSRCHSSCCRVFYAVAFLTILLSQLGSEMIHFALLEVAANRTDAYVHGPVKDDVRVGRARRTTVVHLAELKFRTDIAAAFNVLASRFYRKENEKKSKKINQFQD